MLLLFFNFLCEFFLSYLKSVCVSKLYTARIFRWKRLAHPQLLDVPEVMLRLWILFYNFNWIAIISNFFANKAKVPQHFNRLSLADISKMGECDEVAIQLLSPNITKSFSKCLSFGIIVLNHFRSIFLSVHWVWT